MSELGTCLFLLYRVGTILEKYACIYAQMKDFQHVTIRKLEEQNIYNVIWTLKNNLEGTKLKHLELHEAILWKIGNSWVFH